MKLFLSLVLVFAGARSNPLDHGDHWVDNNDALFMLFTRNHPVNYQLINPKNQSSLQSTDFDPLKPTKVLVHGWQNDFNTSFPQNVKNAYLDVADVNVIIVDWSYASLGLYSIARAMVSTIGSKTSTLLKYLMKNGAQSTSFHLVGHSLGAHIVGIAGSRTIGNLGVTLPRITGLDPAGPLFTYLNSDRIDSTSAEFVDIIHSCGNILGFFDPLGHVDFYPNGGIAPQPGCGLDVDGACSHGRSTQFFADSISQTGSFEGVVCTDWSSYAEGFCSPPPYAEMGENVPYGMEGVYFLSTNDKEPFGRGKEYP